MEFERTFAALEMLYAGVFTQGYPAEFGLVSARFGFLVEAGDIAPYVAGGVGLAAETAQSTLDCSQSRCAVLFGSGPILLGELGLLLFRERRVGRVSIAAQIVEPLFSLSTAGFNTRPPGIPLVLLGGAALPLKREGLTEGCCTRRSLTQKCQDIVDGIQRMDPWKELRGTGEEVVLAVLELRNRHPSWGPDKIARVL